MNWTGIIIFAIAIATIPATIFFVRWLDTRDSIRADQIEQWIRGYLNGPPESSTTEED